MTSPKKGEILRYHRTGGLFEVRKVTSEFVILCARDGSSQIMTGKGSLDSLFDQVFSGLPVPQDLNIGARNPALAGGVAG